jgi:hypothetical protein
VYKRKKPLGERGNKKCQLKEKQQQQNAKVLYDCAFG